VRRFDEGGQDGTPYIGNPNIEAQGAKAMAVAEARPSDITGKIQQFGNMLKDHYNRIVSDPEKYGEDLVNKAQSDLDEVHALHGQAFANPKRPFEVTDPDALSKLSDKYMGSALSFAPLGITKIAGMKPIEALFPNKTFDSLTSGEKAALTRYTKTLETPAVRRREEARLTGTGTIKQPSIKLAPKQGVNPQSLQDKYIVPVLWDTSEAGNAISQIEGIPLTKGMRDPTPTVSETQGGSDYSRILENINQGIAGASMKGAASSKISNLNKFADQGDTVGMVFDMSPEGINFSHHIVEPYIGMLNYLKPTKKALDEFRETIRNTPVQNPNTKIITYPYKKFPGIDSPFIRDLIAEGTNEYSAGNLRKVIAETGNTAKFENMGFPRWEDIYKNVSRPNALTGMGSTIFSVKPNSNIMTPTFKHNSYNSGMGGVLQGSGLINAKNQIVSVPDYMMLQKTFANKQAEEKTIPNIRTSLLKAHHGEKFDQQSLDNLMKYLGYKSGGKVHMGGGGLLVDKIVEKLGRVVLPKAEREANKAKLLKNSTVQNQVYHGTNDDISSFNPDKSGSKTGNVTSHFGIFASNNPKEASRFAEQWGTKGGNVMPLYLQLNNPYEMPYSEFNNFAMGPWNKRMAEPGYDPKKITPVNDMAAQRAAAEAIEKHIPSSIQDVLSRKQELMDMGHDGIVVNIGGNKEYIAFKREQFKSAIGNEGTYDVTNPDINKRRGGKVHMTNDLDMMRHELNTRG